MHTTYDSFRLKQFFCFIINNSLLTLGAVLKPHFWGNSSKFNLKSWNCSKYFMIWDNSALIGQSSFKTLFREQTFNYGKSVVCLVDCCCLVVAVEVWGLLCRCTIEVLTTLQPYPKKASPGLFWEYCLLTTLKFFL